MASRSLFSRVEEAYKNATQENGYTFDGMSDEQVAVDMITCCSDLEDENLYDIWPIVTHLRKTTK